jgi:hypothetical protein
VDWATRRSTLSASQTKDMKLSGFRDDGATEIGDAGEADTRSISGHTQLDTATIYNKASQEKARRIARCAGSIFAKITEQDEDLTE